MTTSLFPRYFNAIWYWLARFFLTREYPGNPDLTTLESFLHLFQNQPITPRSYLALGEDSSLRTKENLNHTTPGNHLLCTIMDSESSNFKIEKLNDQNFHVWKVKVRMLLSIKELDEHLDDSSPPEENNPKYHEWKKKDKKARAFIGLTLSNRHFEQVQHASTAHAMWTSVCDIYEKHTLLNRLSARRRFYTAKMGETEKLLEFSGRIRQYASSLATMGVHVEDQDMAMTLLCGLPSQYDMLISALDAVSDDSQRFTFQFVVSRAQQEELRHTTRELQSVKQIDSTALLVSRNKNKGDCIHCGRHNNSNKCWRMYPELAPEGHPLRRKHKALLSQQRQETVVDEDNIVCLLTSIEVALNKVTEAKGYFATSQSWILDSGCSTHLTFDRSAFISYKTLKPRGIDLGANSSAMIIGCGDVSLLLSVGGKLRKCVIRNVQHVPDLRYQLLSISTMAKQGIFTLFDSSGARLVKDLTNQLVATGSLRANGLYELNVHTAKRKQKEAALVASLSTWHERLGHVSPEGILKMVKDHVAEGIDISTTSTNTCSGRIMGKGHRAPIP